MNPKDRETPFALIHAEVRRLTRCETCLHIYAYLDEVQGDGGLPVQGVSKVVAAIGCQTETAKRHLRDLSKVGLVRLDPEPASGAGWGRVRFAVAHNPARARRAQLREVDGVWGEPPERWKRPPNTDFLRDAQRGALSVVADGSSAEPPEDSEATVSATQRETRCDAARNAVPRSAKRGAAHSASPGMSGMGMSGMDGARDVEGEAVARLLASFPGAVVSPAGVADRRPELPFEEWWAQLSEQERADWGRPF